TDALLHASSLCRDSGPRIVDQNPTHHLSPNSEEMGAVVEGDRFRPEEPDTRLVDQRVRIQRVIAALAAQKARREPAQLRMDDLEEPPARGGVTAAPAGQPFGDSMRRRQVARHSSHDTVSSPFPLSG